VHEYAVIQTLVETVLETLRKRPPCTVREIHVSVGSESGYVEDSLRASYEILAQGTPLGLARLVLVVRGGQAVTLERLVLEE